MEHKIIYKKVIVLGSGQLAYDCAIRVREYIVDVCVVEYKVTEGTVLQKLCLRSGLKYMHLEKNELLQLLKSETKQVLLISACNTFIIPKEIIHMNNYCIVNWHNALLPAHKGRNAEAWAIFAGDDKSGITWHMLTASVDGGDILVSSEVAITDEMTALKLFQKQIELGAKVFADIALDLLRGQCKAYVQPTLQEQQMHYSYEVPNGGILDLMWDFAKMSRFLRAMDYAGLKLLGDMHVIYEGSKYAFNRYRIEKSEEKEGISLENESLIIIRGGNKVTLKKLRCEVLS